MTIIDFNGKAPSSPDNLPMVGKPPVSLDYFNTTALATLSENVVKVCVHLDAVHGVYRQPCGAGDAVSRAKKQHYMLLDLGHVIRLYFGDDYFDLYLDTHVPYQRDASLEALVADVVVENRANEEVLAAQARGQNR